MNGPKIAHPLIRFIILHIERSLDTLFVIPRVIGLVDQIAMYSLTNSTHSTMTTVAKCAYDDFSAPTSLRSARVIVEGRSVYVNPGWLAEFSNFFVMVFFGKNAGQDLTLDDEVSYEHFIELLRVVCYCPTRKPIT
ncbi:unnamed protein product, partial [Onchocerca ochengi]|uniref:BTB domain-containing protein n=1 Tax=Onchocerca ochengi TaxID=42157 RepID=A0A182EHK1_ONCOC